MDEIWKRAVATGGRYEVSNLGNVRRYDGLLVTHSVPRNKREYPTVMLRFDGKRKRVAVHRLVAINFLGLPPCAGAEVRHLDGDHLNPRLPNLAWGTAKQNAADRERHGRTARGPRPNRAGKARGEENGFSTLTADAVRSIRELAGTKSQRAIAVQFGTNQATVWRIIQRKVWAHVD